MIKAIKLKKIVFFVILLCIIFGIFYYKIFLSGNNIIKNRSKDKEQDILAQMENYCADINVTVISNKTQNSYIMHQEVSNDYSMQEVVDGDFIKGLKIELNQDNLKITNTNLKLEKIYENYQNLLNNAMFLNSFSNDYQMPENDSNCYKENEQTILEVKLNNNQNTYIKYKKLYIDNKTKKPTKLEIKSNREKETICIIYNNIELNKA